jgi:hypothetical protein
MPGAKPYFPVLDYESPQPEDPNDPYDSIAFVSSMRAWRKAAGWCFWATIGGVVLAGQSSNAGWAMLGLLGLAGLIVTSGGTLYYMFRAALREVGVRYAVGHLLLAMVLLPVVFLGVFLVTRLVESDFINWRLAERPRESSGQ